MKRLHPRGAELPADDLVAPFPGIAAKARRLKNPPTSLTILTTRRAPDHFRKRSQTQDGDRGITMPSCPKDRPMTTGLADGTMILYPRERVAHA
jgi:hypothetical protein